MRMLIGCVAAAATLISVPASATIYYVQGSGFVDGATFNGSFDASDVDLDGQISSFDGEVSAFAGSFSGNSQVGPLSFTMADLFGLVWSMDDLIGDDVNGDIEGLGLSNGLASYLVGPGPFAFCDGVQNCSAASDGAGQTFSIEGLRVSLTPFPSVPEPSSWALMIAGFGIAGAVLRRKRVRQAVSFA
jgi:hypothetical protein